MRSNQADAVGRLYDDISMGGLASFNYRARETYYIRRRAGSCII